MERYERETTGKATKPQDRGKIFFQTVRHAGSCVAIATATVVAAGCGGGGSGNAAAPTPASAPTPSSGASATAFNIEPMTNVDVANHLGLSDPEVAAVIEELIDDGQPVILRRVDGEWKCWKDVEIIEEESSRT